MSDELIDQYVDRTAFAADTDFIEAQLKRVTDIFDTVNSQKITLQGASSLKDVSTAATQAQGSMEGLKTAVQTTSDRIAQLNGSSKEFTQVLVLQTQAQKNAADANLADTKARLASEAALKKQIEASQKLTQEQKLQKTISESAAGSYNQLNAQLKLLTIQYKNLSDAEQKSSVGQQLQKDIAGTNAQLKILDAGLGNYQRNVGNYNSSLGLLSKGIKGLGGLGLVLSKALGIDPEVATGIEEVGRAIRDIQHARELEEVGLKGETELYAQNEQKIEASVAALDGETASTEAVAGSQAELTASLEGSGVAQTGLAGETALASTALDAEAVSAEAATVATTGFGTALVATGIGAAVIALIAGIVEIVKVVKDYNAGIQSQYEASEALKTILGELASATKEYEDIRTAAAQQEIKDLTQQIDLRKSAGVTSFESLALDKQLASQQLSNANEQAKRYNINNATLQASLKASKEATYALVGEEQLKQDFLNKTAELKDKNYDRDLKAFDDNITQYKKEADAAKSVYDFANDIFQKQSDAKNKIDLLSTQAAKLNADERRALILAEATTEADIITNKNKIILADERSTLDQRLAAIKSNSAQQLDVINATLNNTLNNPTKDDSEKKLARLKANAYRIKENDDTDKLIFDTNETYRKKELKAEDDFNNAVLTRDKTLADNKVTDRYTDLQANLELIKKSGIDQNAILTNNYELTKATTILSERELLALTENYNNAILKNNIDTRNKEVAAQQKAVEDQVAALKYLHDAQISKANDQVDIKDNSAATVLINQAQIDEANANAEKRVKIEKKLQKDLLDVDKKAELDKLQIEQDDLDNQIYKATLIEAPTDAIDKKITENKRKQAALRKGITDDEYNYEEQKRNDFLDKVLQGEDALLDDVQAIGDRKYQLQKDQAQKQSDLLDAQTQRQIDAENASTDSAQDKADKIAVINARSLAEKQALDLKERRADHDKAVFDKEIAILETIAQIAIDIAKGKFFDAGLAGAALIKLIATPVPAYKHGKGKNDKYEGPAIVGDGGKSEMHIHEDGRIERTPAVPTFTTVKRNDIILPDFNMVEFLTGNVYKSHQKFAENGRGYNPNAVASNEALTAEIKSMKNTLASAIKNKKEFHTRSNFTGVMAIHKHGDWWTNYVKEQTQF